MAVINFKGPLKKESKKTMQNILVKDYMSKDVATFLKSWKAYDP